MPLDIFKGVSKAMAPLLAKRIKKEDFLSQLEAAWYPSVSKNSDIEVEVQSARQRIKSSGFEKAFTSAGITDEDIRIVLTKIQESKSTPVHVEQTPSRNSPCPCGSGKKYKRCCGLKTSTRTNT